MGRHEIIDKEYVSTMMNSSMPDHGSFERIIVISRWIILCDINHFGGRKRVGKNLRQLPSGYKDILSHYKKRSYMMRQGQFYKKRRRRSDKIRVGPESKRWERSNCERILSDGAILNIDNFKADRLNNERV
jgi:hypothetical protein